MIKYFADCTLQFPCFIMIIDHVARNHNFLLILTTLDPIHEVSYDIKLGAALVKMCMITW